MSLFCAPRKQFLRKTFLKFPLLQQLLCQNPELVDFSALGDLFFRYIVTSLR